MTIGLERIDQVVTIVSSDVTQARSLILIKAIEETTSYLNAQIDKNKALVDMLHDIAEQLENIEISERYEDLRPGIYDALRGAEANLEDYIAYLKSQKEELKSSGVLETHEDHILDLFDDLIDVTRDLASTFQTIRWTLMEKDADLEEPEEKVFTNAQDLINDLNIHRESGVWPT